MALRGDVMVGFDADWSTTDVYRWAQTNEAEVVRVLNEKKNMYLLMAPSSGMSLFDWVTMVGGQQGVVFARPDWWREAHKR